MKYRVMEIREGSSIRYEVQYKDWATVLWAVKRSFRKKKDAVKYAKSISQETKETEIWP